MMESNGEEKLRGAEELRGKKREVRRRPCLVGCLAGICLLLVAAVIALQWLRGELLSWLEPGQLAAMERAETHVPDVPREWLEKATVPPSEVVRFAEDFHKAMERVARDHETLWFGTGDPLADKFTTRALVVRLDYAMPTLDEDQRTSFAALMKDLSPVIDMVTSATALPGYTLQPAEGTPSYLETKNFVSMMRAKAVVEAAEGKCMSAVESALLPLRMTQRDRTSYIVTHLIAVAEANVAVTALMDVVEVCGDREALMRALELLDGARQIIYGVDENELKYAELFTALRQAKADGAPIDLEGQTEAQLWRQYRWIHSTHYSRWVLDNLPPGSEAYKRAAVRVKGAGGGGMGGNKLMDWAYGQAEIRYPDGRLTKTQRMRNGLLGMDMTLFVSYWLYTGNEAEAWGRVQHSQALYELARLRVAQRLAALDGAKRTEEIMAYLKPAAIDPFTSGPMKVSGGGKFYSLGPDKVDDGGTVLYDATNGAVSRGDVGFREKFR